MSAALTKRGLHLFGQSSQVRFIVVHNIIISNCSKLLCFRCSYQKCVCSFRDGSTLLALFPPSHGKFSNYWSGRIDFCYSMRRVHWFSWPRMPRISSYNIKSHGLERIISGDFPCKYVITYETNSVCATLIPLLSQIIVLSHEVRCATINITFFSCYHYCSVL